ncbi:PAS domain S-box protein [Thermodesulfobacteriota bacterium]
MTHHLQFQAGIVIFKAEHTMEDRDKNKEQLISELQATRLGLHETGELFRTLFYLSTDAIVVYDIQGRALYTNPAFSWMFGWTFEEVKGKRIDFVPESEIPHTMEAIRLIIDKGSKLTGFETKRFTKEGAMVDVTINAGRYHDSDGEAAGMLVILKDITERNQVYQRLSELENEE